MMLSENFTWKEMQKRFTRDGVCQSSTKPFKDDSFLVYILGELQHTDESHICSLMFTWLCDELLMFCSLSIKVSANCIKTDFVFPLFVH